MEEFTSSAELRAQLAGALEALRGAATPLEALGYLVYLTGESAEEPEEVRKYIDLAEEQLAVLRRILGPAFNLA